jgi:hypothetical protein
MGRPISPFPRKGSSIPENKVDDGDDESSDVDLSLEQPEFHPETIQDRHVPEALEDAQEPGSEIEVQQGQIEATEISMAEHVVPFEDLAHDNHFGELLPHPEDVRVDIETGDERTCQDGNTPAPERDTTAAESHPVVTQQENLISTDIFDVRLDSGDEGELIGEERPDEEIVVRSLSDEPPSVTSPQQRPLEPQLLEDHIEVDEPMAESLDTESEGDSSDESDLSVVKIVSDDP